MNFCFNLSRKSSQKFSYDSEKLTASKFRQISLKYSDVWASKCQHTSATLHAITCQKPATFKWCEVHLVSGTEIKKPARKATQFNSGLWSATLDNPISFAPGEGIPESAASRNEYEGRLFSYLCDGVCEKGQPGRDLFLLWKLQPKKFYSVVWAETRFRGMMHREIKYKFVAHSIVLKNVASS
jgi:hypothetical protein